VFVCDFGSAAFQLPNNGGEGGIRTHVTLSDNPVFKTGAFNRSATSPSRKSRIWANLYETDQNAHNAVLYIFQSLMIF
jgi:hypothetical protein